MINIFVLTLKEDLKRAKKANHLQHHYLASPVFLAAKAQIFHFFEYLQWEALPRHVQQQATRPAEN